MSFLSSLGIVAFAAALPITAAHAFDDSNYPAFSGVWRKPAGIGNQWDQAEIAKWWPIIKAAGIKAE